MNFNFGSFGFRGSGLRRSFETYRGCRYILFEEDWYDEIVSDAA